VGRGLDVGVHDVVEFVLLDVHRGEDAHGVAHEAHHGQVVLAFGEGAEDGAFGGMLDVLFDGHQAFRRIFMNCWESTVSISR
jgi:hypothetical protein